jgi:hypothetical protein
MFKKYRNKIATGVTGVTALVAAGAASAGELADAAVGSMDKTELVAIGVGVLILCGVVTIVKMGKRTTG